MNLNIRVCGQETLAVVDVARKFYINGVVEGDAATMSEA